MNRRERLPCDGSCSNRLEVLSPPGSARHGTTRKLFSGVHPLTDIWLGPYGRTASGPIHSDCGSIHTWIRDAPGVRPCGTFRKPQARSCTSATDDILRTAPVRAARSTESA